MPIGGFTLTENLHRQGNKSRGVRYVRMLSVFWLLLCEEFTCRDVQECEIESTSNKHVMFIYYRPRGRLSVLQRNRVVHSLHKHSKIKLGSIYNVRP